MTTTTEQAQAIEADLRVKAADARTALAETDERRSALAYAANVEGGEAKKQLDKLNRERGLLVAEIDGLDVATAEAARRVGAAEADEERAILAAQAGRALEIAAAIRQRGRKLGELIEQFAAEAKAMKKDLDGIHALGCTHPTHEQFAVLGTLAMKTAAMGSPFRWEHLAPRERKNYADLGESFAAQIERWAEPRLAPPKAEAA